MSAPGHPGGSLCKAIEVDLAAERDVARVDFQDSLAPGDVWKGDDDAAVEAPRAQERRV